MLSASSDPQLSTKRFVRSHKELEDVYTKDMVDLIYLSMSFKILLKKLK